jgi:hypothetical protein
MPKGKTAEDLTTLQMALVGYEVEKQKIDEKIRQIEALLKGTTEAKAKPVRRQLSAAARKRISAAQRKRWAEHRRVKAAKAK